MTTPLSSTKVLVTGANGFIGLHLLLHLLELGYSVRATVRTNAQEKKVREALSGRVGTSQLEFAFTDLCADRGWKEAVYGCDSVIHTAAPYPIDNPKDESELIIPIRDGTLRVLRAAKAEGIHRVVIVSSSGAVFDGHMGENRAFDESDWTDLEKCRNVYHKGKVLAERAAWDFIHSAENKSGMELVAINPSAVFGPVLDNHHHTSVEWFRALMCAEVPGVPKIRIPMVDVRDLVDILAKAMTQPGAAGKRFLCTASTITAPEFANILHEGFSDRGYRIPTRILPDWVIRIIGLFSPKIKAVSVLLGWEFTLSNKRARSVFDWQPRPYKQTILDMAESLIKFGMV